jgi:D-glycero-D-manno-heptose 1,7-bisphosphate phosphatase
MVGDTDNDVYAGRNAGCKTALLCNKGYGEDIAVDSLLDFVKVL